MIGAYPHSIDPKGRLFIPAPFRPKLGNDIVIAKSVIGDCLRIYSAEKWEEFYQDKIKDLPQIEAFEVSFWLTSNAERARIDDQGRIAIKASYREFANLKTEIVSCGRGEFIEIWNAQEFDKKQQSIDMDKIREILMKRGF